jgi:autotransporter-associated beta strand protein
MRCYHISKPSWALAILFAWAVLVAPALATDSTWKTDGAANWSDAANWTAGVPDGIGDIARLTYSITAPRTVTIDGSIPTVGSLYLSGTTSGYMLAGAGLNLDVSSGSALIQSDGGTGFTHTISAPVSLYDGTTVAVNSGTLQVSGAISSAVAGKGIAKSGAGTLILGAANTYTGTTTISGGALQALDGTSLPSASFLSFGGGVLESSGTFTRPLGTSGNAVAWTTNGGGFSAQGGKLTVAIGGTANPTSLTWTYGGFVPAKSTLIFGSSTADSEVEFTNNIKFTDESTDMYKLVVNDNPASTGDFATLSGVLSGRGFRKLGAGTLVLKGANTYTSAASVYGGTLRLGSDQAIASGTSVNILNGSTIDMAGYTMSPASVTVNDGTLMGAGSVMTAGVVRPQKGQVLVRLAGTVCVDKETSDTGIMTGVNTYTGWTDIYGGTLRANDGVGLSPNSTVYFGSGVLEITGGGTFTRSIGKGPGQVWWWPDTGAGGFAALGGKVTVAIGGTASPTNLVHGTGVGFEDLRFGSATADSEVEFKNNIDVGNAFLNVCVVDNPDSTGDFATLSGNLTNGYVLDKMGTGMLVLSGTNTLRGAVVDYGTLRLGSGHALGTVTDVTVSQSGTLDVGTYHNAVGSLTLMGGSIIGNGSLISAGSMSLQRGTISASLGGTGGLDKWDVYTVYLAGANSYSGVTTVSWGTLQIGSDKAIPSGGAIIITYDYVNGTGEIGTLYIGPYNVTAGTVTLAGGAIVGSTGVLSATNLDARKGTITACLGGAGTFTKTTNDMVTLGGANTFTGPTIVCGGTLRLATNSAIPSGGNVTVQGGILDIGAYGPNAGTVSLLDGAITGSTGVLEAATLDLRKGTVSAILGGSTGPSKTTADTVALTAANAYSGPTIVYGGTLQAVSGIGLPSASNLVLASGDLEGIGVTTFTRTPGASGANTVQWTASGGFSASGGKMTVAMGGITSPTALTWGSGNFVPADSALVFGSSTADNETEFMNGINLAGAARTVTVNDNTSSGADFATISGALSNGGLVKDGPGTLVLSGANNLTGGATVSAGTLRLAGAAALASGNAVTVQGGSTLDIGTYSCSAGTVTLADGTITGTTGILAGLGYDVRKGTVAAKFGGTAGLTKTTADTVTLTAGNTFTGPTTVSGGTLRLGASNTLPGGSNLTVQGGSTLDIGTYSTNAATVTLADGTIVGTTGVLTGLGYEVRNGTVTAKLGGAAGLTKTTADVVTLSGINAFTGPTTVSGGTLRVGTRNALPRSSDVTVQGGSTLDIGTYTTWAGTVTLADGTIIGTTGVLTGVGYEVRKGTVSARLGGAGALTKTTADTVTLAAPNTFTGATTVAAGTLKLAAGATLASTALDVQPGATLDLRDLVGGLTLGAGKSLKGGGRVLGDLVVGGTLSPGESPGILSVEDITFAAGSILNMELGGTVRGGGYDALASGGDVVLQNGSTLSVSLISNFVPEMGDEFDILDFSSLSGQFTTINLPALAGGLSWRTDDLYLDGTIGVTPEPATLALLGLGIVGVLCRRRVR